jgi:N-sulfoglucosamine sulfohydrolase
MRADIHSICLKTLLVVAALFLASGTAYSADQPNILWITSEDNSPYLGCYGDPLAQTPNLDGLAAQGVRYRQAHANAPVCSSARTTLITGMYASSLGAHHHRSRVAIPERFKLYPEHLRAAGYYCSNNSKEDYNLERTRKIWDESSNKAHYRNRAHGQPFFAIFNFTISHEGQVAPKAGKTAFRVPPDSIPLPPYHPDTPEIRLDWANYYDQMTLLDAQVGKLLDELEQADLADDTIVFYYSDHGGALPRGKRNIHDSGTRVPLIVRFPKKWAHLAPARPGDWVDDLVSFVDFPATLFSLCGVQIPEYYEGKPFLGEKKAAPRDHVFLFRGRMDERYDTVRAVRDHEFRYVRNYSPHRPWGQHYSYPFQVQPSMRSWFAEYQAGRCNEIQSAYWRAKPGEEFYQIAGDPFELHNLISDPRHAAGITKLRAALRAEILATRDTGFIPEGMFAKLAGGQTIYHYAHSTAYPLERIIEIADMASDGEPAHLPALIAALDDPHPVIRYWAATGCLILAEKAGSAKPRLRARLNDEWADVRVAAAEALAHLGDEAAAVATIAEVLKTGNPHEALAAQNALDFMREAGWVTLARAQDLVRDLKFSEPGDRIPRHLLGIHPSLSFTHTDVFVSGQDGYHTYRIPAIETAPDGTLLAFAEARKHNAADPGAERQDIDLVYKRSTDRGATWSPMILLEDPGELWSAANPATVVDRTNERVWLFYLRSRPGRSTHTSRPGTDDMQTMARWSDDHGQSWSDPLDLTVIARDMKDPNWRASVPGPGGAIQSRTGRLLVPVWKYPFANLAIYSDDHGLTWARGQFVPGTEGGDEAQVVELPNGNILMDVRQNSGPHRWLTESSDGGETWAMPRPGQAVTRVACALERITIGAPGKERDYLLWTGPKGPDRRRLVIRSSDDHGKTFGGERLVWDGYAAYSELTILKDGTVGILWERGVERNYQFITFTPVCASWIFRRL